MLCENILVYDKNNNNITVSDDMGELANVRRDDKDGCNVSSHAGSGSAGAGINALVNKVNSFEYKKCSKSCLSALQSQISATKNSLKMYELAVDKKNTKYSYGA
jgi:hypothetical protein